MRRSPALAYSLAGAIFYVVFLLWTIPAQFASAALARWTKGMVNVAVTRGTIWSGGGELVLMPKTGGPRSLGEGSWKLNPLWLVFGRASLVLDFEGPDTQVRGTATLVPMRRHARLERFQFAVPATLVNAVYAPAAFFGPAGRLTFITEEFLLMPKALQGRASVTWQDAASDFSSVKPLGDYRLHLVGVDDALQLRLETLRGDLDLTGEGQFKSDTNAVQFTLVAKPIGHAEELEPLLKLFGAGQGQGERKLQLNVPLKLF